MDRYTQKANIRAAERRKLLAQVKQLATDIGRCERTIAAVMTDLNEANAKHQGTRNTREEIEYLKVLLECAKKKLAWETQIGSLKKRAPALLEEMSRIMNDTEFPPDEQVKTDMLGALGQVQGALERLQAMGA